MKWNDHSKDIPKGSHAILSPSRHAFVRYDKSKLFTRYRADFASDIGDTLHAYAKDLIKFKKKLTRYHKQQVELELLRNGIPENVFDIDILFDNFKNYVNDAIGYQLDPEQPLKYSDNAYGTADAIAYTERRGDPDFDGELRIHDLKTGLSPASMEQLELYAALFFLEYPQYKVGRTKIILCIYQNFVDDDDEIVPDIFTEEPDPERIAHFMDVFVTMDKWVNGFKGD